MISVDAAEANHHRGPPPPEEISVPGELPDDTLVCVEDNQEEEGFGWMVSAHTLYSLIIYSI